MTRVSRRHSGQTRSAIRRPATSLPCSGSTPPRSSRPPAGEYGTAPVAPFRLPGRHQWDIAISKNLSLGGTARLQFRADLINAFNHTQFLDINTTLLRHYGVRLSWRIRPGHEHETTSRDPAWREAELVTPAGREGHQPILERPSLRALVAFLSRLLIVYAALVSGHSSTPAAQAAGVQTTTPIPGFAASLQMITELLDRGRGIEAENVARALLARVESTMGRDVREVADVLDLLGRAIRRSSKVKDEEKTELAERAVAIREKVLGPAHPRPGDEPHQPWRPADAGGRSCISKDRCSNVHLPFERPRSVPTIR